jgi:hypothetical protein
MQQQPDQPLAAWVKAVRQGSSGQSTGTPLMSVCVDIHLHAQSSTRSTGMFFASLLCPAATGGGESASKKAKQQQAAKPASSGPRPLAVVGDKQLAATRPAIVRELYAESAELSAMPESEVQNLLEERRTVVTGSSLRPVMSFEQTGLPADMLHATRDFVQPSPIQSQVWPTRLLWLQQIHCGGCCS